MCENPEHLFKVFSDLESDTWLVASDGCVWPSFAARMREVKNSHEFRAAQRWAWEDDTPAARWLKEGAKPGPKGTRSRKGDSKRRRKTLPKYSIAQRDNWICHLCGSIIDKRRHHLQGIDPWALSADHLVPVSKGGSDDETNLKAAHWICNVRRGNADLPVVVGC